MRENQAEDRRCLTKVEEIFEDQRKKGVPISGLIIEPIQAEGGDNHASKEFFHVTYLFLTTVKLGYNKLGYSKLPLITNR